MKFPLFALCVLLPALCMSTPLPDATASSLSSATATGDNTSANANSSASSSTPTPTTGTPTPTSSPTGTSTACSSASSSSQAHATGANSNASSSSSATAKSGSSGNTAKPTSQGFSDYSVLVFTQGDLQKYGSVQWTTWKTTKITTEVIQSQYPACAPFYFTDKCKGAAIKFDVISDKDVEYTVFGSDETYVVEIKQKLTVVEQGFHLFQMEVTEVASATISSQEVVVVKEQESFKSYFDKTQFAILGSDFKTYFVAVTNGEQRVVFVCVSIEVYNDDSKKQEIWPLIVEVLVANNIQESELIEVAATVDYQSYDWASCSQSSSSASASSKASSQTNGKGGKSDAEANCSATAKTGDQSPSGSPTPTSGTPTPTNNDNNTAKASSKSDATAKGDNAKATADSSANASGGGKSGSSGQSGGSFVECGKPDDVPGFEQYSVLVKNEQFVQSIVEKTFFVWKITQVTEEVATDVTVCADRYICSSCVATKFQYTKCKEKQDMLVLKEWGYDGTNLLFIQENISFASSKYVIFQSEVVNVMKANKDSDTAVSVDNDQQVKSYLSSQYAVLGTDGEKWIIIQTSSQQGSVTVIAVIEEVYTCEKKQQEIAQCITQVLQANCIDESTLSIVLTKQFDVDTNKFNKVSQKSEVETKNGQTTTKQETTTEGSNAKTKSSTSTQVGGGSSPSSTPTGEASAKGCSDAKAEDGVASAKTESTAEVKGTGTASSTGSANATSG